MIKLCEEGLDELWEEYNTMEILDAVDALDKVRYVISDDYDFKPPEIRYQLLKIHTLAFKLLGEGFTLKQEQVEELSDLIDGVNMTVSDMIEQLRRIREALRPLEKMFTWEE